MVPLMTALFAVCDILTRTKHAAGRTSTQIQRPHTLLTMTFVLICSMTATVITFILEFIVDILFHGIPIRFGTPEDEQRR